MSSQKVLVAGTGISGIAAAKLLLDCGGEVVLYDSNDQLKEEELKEKFQEGSKVTVVLGELKRTDLLGVELCIISPGIPLEAPFVAVLDDMNIPIWSEIQLAYHRERPSGCHYRNQWKNHHYGAHRPDHEGLL